MLRYHKILKTEVVSQHLYLITWKLHQKIDSKLFSVKCESSSSSSITVLVKQNRVQNFSLTATLELLDNVIYVVVKIITAIKDNINDGRYFIN